MNDHISHFLLAMGAAGIRSLEPIAEKLASGEPVRFRADGDKPGRRNGWACLHLDGVPAGVFRHYRLGVRTVWRADSKSSPMSQMERRDILARVNENRVQRKVAAQAKQDLAEGVAHDMWSGAGKPDPAHGYLERKGLPPFGVRQNGDTLLVPMVDRDFRLRNVQRIYPNGHKLFLPGGRTGGLFWPHGAHWQDGSPSKGTLIVGEGYATVAAIHDATGYGVIAAMSALNLRAVASTARDLFPTREIVIAADNDSHLPENVGLNAAREAAQVIGACVATPEQQACSGGSGTDFADIPRVNIAGRIATARRGG